MKFKMAIGIEKECNLRNVRDEKYYFHKMKSKKNENKLIGMEKIDFSVVQDNLYFYV